MPVIMVRGDVEDLDKWKRVFDANTENRRAHGCQRVQRFRQIDNQNNILVLFDWDTAENAESFMANPRLAKIQKQSGMAPNPDTAMFEEI